MFSTSQHFSAKSSTGEDLVFQKTKCCSKCTNAVKLWLGVLKEEGDKYVHAVCEFIGDTTTPPAIGGKKSVYDAFKNFSHCNGIGVAEYRYVFCKALELKLIVEEMSGSCRKRLYNFSEMVEVTKKARMDNGSG
eukprot:5089093-Ditylum_brightwellii.AAC.1